VFGPLAVLATSEPRVTGGDGLFVHPEWSRPFVVLSILTIVAWVGLRSRLGATHAVFAGVLLVGSVYAGVVGSTVAARSSLGVASLALALVLVPFGPFGTAIVFALSARDALRRASASGISFESGAAVVAAAALASVAVPVAAGEFAKSRVADIAHDLGTYQPEHAARDVWELGMLARFPGVSLTPVVARYDELANAEARDRLDSAMRTATGLCVREFADHDRD
jgi:hypothetical protein